MNEEDLTAKELPIYSAEDLGITIVNKLSKEHIALGDTFDYTVSVTWESNAVLALVPQSSVVTKSLDFVQMSQNSSRMVHDGKTLSTNEFVYKIVVLDTGTVTIPELNFMVPVQNAHAIGLRSKPLDIYVHTNSSVLPVFGGALAFCAIILAFIFKKRKRVAIAKQKIEYERKRQVILEEMNVLKARLSVADSRTWLQSLESTLKHFAKWKYGTDDLEYLVKNNNMKDFENLTKLFAEARYGGGNRNEFENRETYKEAWRLMQLEE